ncbi:2OG-Fe(II) oxygenase [uncultured Roseobacter sp.]|uniref:2OG-Fe(II) oxygenase n=1 Tax=uncultured Roseobacter sp. TaxID=114847 RepID=UPI00262288E9|nr:2OG-Fe(II) oxygenase [uncultured Roseobacter sp.]
MTQDALARARALDRPTRDAMLQRAPEAGRFWHENQGLFEAAWKEWEQANPTDLDASVYDSRLRAAVEAAWKDPATEGAVRDLWEEVFPGVYKTRFFDPERLCVLRSYLDKVASAGIPLRPPYGISLNRGGAMLDPRSEGYLGAPAFQTFYRGLMNTYMRPVSRLLFPDIMGCDTQTFGFSVQWQAEKDASLRPHSDASSVTLNINLNLPGESFSGSAVSFIDPATRRVKKLYFEPGTALIHHGSVPHASEPIIQGQRTNFVLWLYGRNGRIPHPDAEIPRIDPRVRWTVPPEPSDGFAPF